MSTTAGSPRGAFLGALDVRIDQPLASAGSRSLAYMIDASIELLLQLILVLAALLGGVISFEEDLGTTVAIIVVALFAIEWTYFIFWEQVLSGQSPGKRLLGLRVVRDDGGEPGFVNSVLRNLMRPIDLLPGSYCAGVVSIFLTERHQRLGDLVAGTVVVAEGKQSALPVPQRFPEGFSEDDVRLVEAWFQRYAHLQPEARQRLVQQLWEWLERAHGEFLEHIEEADKEAALHRAFDVGTPA